MKTKPYIEKYPCRCSGGDFCYIVREPSEDVDVGYSTKEEAEKALKELNE